MSVEHVTLRLGGGVKREVPAVIVGPWAAHQSVGCLDGYSVTHRASGLRMPLPPLSLRRSVEVARAMPDEAQVIAEGFWTLVFRFFGAPICLDETETGRWIIEIGMGELC